MTELAKTNPGQTVATVDHTTHLRELHAGWMLSVRSENTRKAYASDFEKWVLFLVEHDIAVLDAGPDHVNAYMRTCEGEELSPATVARRIAVVSSFYRHCVRRRVLTLNPADVKRPDVDPDHSETVGLTAEEAQRLIRTAQQLAADAVLPRVQRTAARDAAIIALMLCTGGRVSEVCSAMIEKLGYDRGHRVLYVQRKGGKWQSIPLGGAAEIIDRHVALAGRTEGTIFVTRTGRPVDRSYVFRAVRKIALAAHLPSANRLSPHSLRHTFATVSLDCGATLDDLQDAMGHADPRTTRRYDRARNRIDRSPVHAVSRAFLGGSP